MLKKTAITILGLVTNSILFAGTMGPVCTPGNVTVPCAERYWELGADALYLRSVYGSDKSYLTRAAAINGFATGQSSIVHVNNAWDWGYRLMGAYHFNTGNDVSVNWTHFSTTTRQPNITGLIQPILGGALVFPATLVDRNRLDQVNIVMGQRTDIGLRDKMRFYAGMQYVNIQSTAQNYFSPTPLIETVFNTPSLSLFNNTDYKGYGPSIGIDYAYDLGFIDGLSITANGAGSILYGTSRYHIGLVADEYGVIAAQAYYSKKGIVPSLEAKLGLNYARSFAQGIVSVDVGYQAMNYFNALITQQNQNITKPFTSVNYGLFGPYFGMKYTGNA